MGRSSESEHVFILQSDKFRDTKLQGAQKVFSPLFPQKVSLGFYQMIPRLPGNHHLPGPSPPWHEHQVPNCEAPGGKELPPSDDSLSEEGRYKKEKPGFNTKTNRCLMFNGKFVCIVSLRHLIFIMCSRDLYGNTRHRNESLSRFIKLRESIDFHTLRAWHGVKSRLIL